MDWVVVYEFSADTAQIAALQKTTLGPTEFGLSAEPALVGVPAWWEAIDRGVIPRYVIEGKISQVYWASMGDWPEFELTGDDGAASKWTREGDVARYVEGLRLRLAFVIHPWKKPNRSRSEPSKLVLRVEIEASERRSDPRAPGPGGVGLRDGRRG